MSEKVPLWLKMLGAIFLIASPIAISVVFFTSQVDATVIQHLDRHNESVHISSKEDLRRIDKRLDRIEDKIDRLIER